jgi:hypothetical protein
MPSICALVAFLAQRNAGVLQALLDVVCVARPRRVAQAARKLFDALQVPALAVIQAVVHARSV